MYVGYITVSRDLLPGLKSWVKYLGKTVYLSISVGTIFLFIRKIRRPVKNAACEQKLKMLLYVSCFVSGHEYALQSHVTVVH